MRKRWHVATALVGTAALALGLVTGCGGQSQPTASSGSQPQQKIVLRAVTPFSQASPEHDGFWLFTEAVKQKLGDKVEIKYLGADDVIKPADQFEALGQGMYDIGHLPGNYAEAKLPIADTLHLSQLSPMEERQKGVYDILKKEFESKMNIEYLGKTAGPGYQYDLYTNFPVKTLADFKGKTIRTAPVYIPLVKALGASPVSIAPGDIYTAMQRNVVDGYGWPTIGVVAGGWAEVTKYRIDPGFYQVGMGVFINKTAWDKLPQDIQKALQDIMKDIEQKSYDAYAKKVQAEDQQMQAKGVKVNKLPDDVAKQFVKLAEDEAWKAVIAKDPTNGQKLKDLTSK
ncbi:MAG: TRAP transporter substrate-binding protein DctP [Desulfitobacteriaceae bacterium]